MWGRIRHFGEAEDASNLRGEVMLLSLIVLIVETLLFVLMVVFVIKKFSRNDRRSLPEQRVRSTRLEKGAGPIEQVVTAPPQPDSMAAKPSTHEVQASPRKTTFVGRGNKIVRLEEFARGDKIVTRVSRFKQSGKQVGKTEEQPAPIEKVLDTVVKR